MSKKEEKIKEQLRKLFKRLKKMSVILVVASAMAMNSVSARPTKKQRASAILDRIDYMVVEQLDMNYYDEEMLKSELYKLRKVLKIRPSGVYTNDLIVEVIGR